MLLDTKWDLGELVYLQTDPNQYQRMVIGYIVFMGGIIQYQLAIGELVTDHYDFEITKDKNILVNAG